MSQPQAELSTELLTWAARDTTPQTAFVPQILQNGEQSLGGPGSVTPLKASRWTPTRLGCWVFPRPPLTPENCRDP